jgi:hypothetical protein
MIVERIAKKIVREYRNKFIYEEIIYKPKKFHRPENIVNMPSAWKGIELIILDLIEFSGIKRNSALEFGVEYGYSTSALSNYFGSVTGVDLFTGDLHTGKYEDIFEQVQDSLREFKNINLVKSDYKDFIRKYDDYRWNLIHVDIVHTYEATIECGLWSATHSDLTIFHDTQSFPEVKRAVAEVAKKTGKRFCNYRPANGLGIVF